MNKAVFIDRDGTLIHDYGYNYRSDQLTILPNTIEVLKKINRMGYLLIIITNQSGIGRGFYSVDDYYKFHSLMINMFTTQGINIKATYFCPHTKENMCDCRKPKPGMVLRAAREHNIEIGQSYFIGDKDDDMLCAKASGCKAVRIVGDYPDTAFADYRVKDILEFGELLGAK